ncbi:hypothetical protein DNTS_004850 [Danionella cerebrum]|uniref:RELT-like protein 2 n=1 Tax=Danionella cerebrum TaxID=2873325 RepID=A0A553RAZ9_9TELE|nr:hypothetical protein DNTS_004850 [Danionella translucida]
MSLTMLFSPADRSHDRNKPVCLVKVQRVSELEDNFHKTGGKPVFGHLCKEARGMTEQEPPAVDDPPPTYTVFLLVFFFFITGLLGFLFCHLLKIKGYRCELEEDEEDCEGKLGSDKDGKYYVSEDSQDTVEQILKCIIENEANMEAFKDMLVTQNVCEHQDQRLLHKDSIAGLPLHHHTVHAGAEISTCVHCMQDHVLKSRRRSRVAKLKARPGEQTVLSVGRFRVTHTDKRNSLHGSMNLPFPKPGNASNDTTLSESRMGSKDSSKKSQEEYNIRNMFKDNVAMKVSNPTGKRKKSVTLLSFQRSNSPVETKSRQEVFVEEKEGSTTADQLSASLEEYLSSVPETPVDPQTDLDENANQSSGDKVETLNEIRIDKHTSDEETLSNKSQDKLSTSTSKNCSRFSVVRTVEEDLPAATSGNREEDTTEQEDFKTDQLSQKSMDTSK